MEKKEQQPKKPSIWSILAPYKGLVIPLVVMTLLANGLTLWLPRLLSHGIDGYLKGTSLATILWEFGLASVGIFILTYIQNIYQVYASERVAKDLRSRLSEKISTNSFAQVEQATPAKLLTNLTSDIDAIKTFVAQAIAGIFSSLFLILVGSGLLLSLNWKLGLAVMAIIPIIGGTFYFIFQKVRVLFGRTRVIIDWLNKVISESILGAPLIRVLNSQNLEQLKFEEVNTEAKNNSIKIVKMFSAMVPIITFVTNLAILTILVLGGKYIISGTMTLGEFAAFNSYLAILIFPIMIIGFMSTLIAQAQASYDRIVDVLAIPTEEETGTIIEELKGSIQVSDVDLIYGEKFALRNVSLSINPGTRVAIIGPTAAGKTQLLSLLVGLIQPTKGTINYDNKSINLYQRENFYKQIGLVFQDSIMFNISLRENIAFNTEVTQVDLEKAIQTAELEDFIKGLPEGLDTLVSERGTSLSGGQKQRIMLARALSINPRILLLDDFTSRVDTNTEQKILANVAQNYPGLTLVSVTQKISSVEHYDQIIVLMEGEVIATGRHEELMHSSPEYVQIFNSQQSTSEYEL